MTTDRETNWKRSCPETGERRDDSASNPIFEKAYEALIINRWPTPQSQDDQRSDEQAPNKSF